MKKTQIEVAVGDGKKLVPAYLSETAGLAVNRNVTYVPGSSDHKLGNTWQVTHISTGKRILTSDGVSTKREASEIAARLNGHADWTEEEPIKERSDELRTLLRKITKEVVNGLEPGTLSPETEPKKTARRFVVRKLDDFGYGVIDAESGSVTEKHMHRGVAAQAAKKLNERF